MSLLSRLRDWVTSLFGSGGAAAEAEGTAPAADHTCSVCDTPVEDPAEGCPLCGSLEVEPRTPTDSTEADDEGGSGEASGGPTTDAADGTGVPGPARQSVEGTTDDAVTRLRDVRRGEGDGEGADEGNASAPDGAAMPDEDGDGSGGGPG